MDDPITDLDAMIERVTALVDVLERDPTCDWSNIFRRWLADAEESRLGASHGDAFRLASELTLFFVGGSGSFNDYISHFHGRPAMWTNEVAELSKRVAAIAWHVRRQR